MARTPRTNKPTRSTRTTKKPVAASFAPLLPPQPDRASRRLALLTIIGLVLVLGAFGAILQLWVAPLLAYSHAPTPPVQEVRMAALNDSYEPSVFVVNVGQPVRWTIDTTRASGCTNSIIIPDLNIRRLLTGNSTIIEFTPTKQGRMPFACSTAAAQGYFDVQ